MANNDILDILTGLMGASQGVGQNQSGGKHYGIVPMVTGAASTMSAVRDSKLDREQKKWQFEHQKKLADFELRQLERQEQEQQRMSDQNKLKLKDQQNQLQARDFAEIKRRMAAGQPIDDYQQLSQNFVPTQTASGKLGTQETAFSKWRKQLQQAGDPTKLAETVEAEKIIKPGENKWNPGQILSTGPIGFLSFKRDKDKVKPIKADFIPDGQGGYIFSEYESPEKLRNDLDVITAAMFSNLTDANEKPLFQERHREQAKMALTKALALENQTNQELKQELLKGLAAGRVPEPFVAETLELTGQNKDGLSGHAKLAFASMVRSLNQGNPLDMIKAFSEYLQAQKIDETMKNQYLNTYQQMQFSESMLPKQASLKKTKDTDRVANRYKKTRKV